MINIGIIGYGYWGPNLVRNFNNSDQFKVKAVCDLDRMKLEPLQQAYPFINIDKTFDELITDSSIDAIAIATPISTHYDLSIKALQTGKHVFVEKPMADTSLKCMQLIEESEKRNLVLFVDHTFPYTESVNKIKHLITNNILGEIYYFDSTRVNLGLFDFDSSVIWDLAIHDLSIVEYLFDTKPISVSGVGKANIDGQPINIASISLNFNNNLYVHINVNWLSPVKIRKILISGDKKMLVYDDIEPTEKIKIYDKGIDVYDDLTINKIKYGYRSGDVNAPYLQQEEPLLKVVENFADVINGISDPLLSRYQAMNIIKILEAAALSIRHGGKPESLI